MSNPTMQEKYIQALEKLNEALENKLNFLTINMSSMNQEILALRASNGHYERIVAVLESEKVDYRAAINDLNAELKERGIKHVA
jgi:DNA-binding transcriptional MocR family regulator